MAASPKPAANTEGIEEARPHELTRERVPEMSDRLARLHKLCKQMTAIAGAAKRR